MFRVQNSRIEVVVVIVVVVVVVVFRCFVLGFNVHIQSKLHTLHTLISTNANYDLGCVSRTVG